MIKKIGMGFILIAFLVLGINFKVIGKETKANKEITDEEMQIFSIHTLKCIEESKIDRAFIIDNEHKYQFLEAIDIALYNIKNKDNLTYIEIYSYTNEFTESLFSLTGDSHLCFASREFLKLMQIDWFLKKGNIIIDSRTRTILFIRLFIVREKIKSLIRQNSI